VSTTIVSEHNYTRQQQQITRNKKIVLVRGHDKHFQIRSVSRQNSKKKCSTPPLPLRNVAPTLCATITIIIIIIIITRLRQAGGRGPLVEWPRWFRRPLGHGKGNIESVGRADYAVVRRTRPPFCDGQGSGGGGKPAATAESKRPAAAAAAIKNPTQSSALTDLLRTCCSWRPECNPTNVVAVHRTLFAHTHTHTHSQSRNNNINIAFYAHTLTHTHTRTREKHRRCVHGEDV